MSVTNKMILKKILLSLSAVGMIFLFCEILIAKTNFLNLPVDEEILWRGAYDGNQDILREHFKYHNEIGYIKSDALNATWKTSDNNSFKILILGDSISWQKKYVKSLENEISQNNINYEIINHGTPGYDTSNEIMLYKKIRKILKPDILLVQLCLNDFDYTPVVIRNGSSWVTYNFGEHSGFLNKITKLNSNFLSFIAIQVFRMQKMYFSDKGDWFAQLEAGRKKIKNDLKEFQKLAKSDGTKLRIIVFPFFAPRKFQENQLSNLYGIFKELELEEEIINLVPLYPEKDYIKFRKSEHDFTHPGKIAASIAGKAITASILPLMKSK